MGEKSLVYFVIAPNYFVMLSRLRYPLLGLLAIVAFAGCDGFGSPKTSTPASAYCWGSNEEGQLGINSINDEIFPKKVVGGYTFTDIAAGGAVDTVNGGPGPVREGVYENVYGHTCAVTEDGDTYCWGNNKPGDGQLGIGSIFDKAKPTKVKGEQNWNAVAAGGYHTCGVTKDGTAYCWGNNDPGHGQLGIGNILDKATPTKVKGDHHFVDLAAGRDHTCGVDFATDGDIGVVYCWGNNSPGQGQLGTGTNNDEITPTPVKMPEEVSFESVVAGGNHTCALTTAGTAYCWGNNTPGQGQLGTGTTGAADDDQLVPEKVKGGHKFKDLAAGGMLVAYDNSPGWGDPAGPIMVGHTCGVTETGDAYCWGNNSPGQGQLGTGTNNDEITPTQVQGGHTFESVVAGGLHTCGLTDDGTAYCWGNNTPGQGQLGTGTTGAADDDRLVPEKVETEQSFAGLTAGGHHTCGIISTN